MTETTRRVAAIIGAGKLGTALARLLIAAGYQVRVSASSDPELTRLTLGILVPEAQVGTTEQIVPGADVVILALPLSKVSELPAELFEGRLVLDATNHWEPVDGHLAELVPDGRTTDHIRALLPGARVAKAFSHLGYHELEWNTGQGVGMGIAGEAEVLDEAAQVVADAGFVPVILGPIAASAVVEPGGALFGIAEPAARVQQIVDHHRQHSGATPGR